MALPVCGAGECIAPPADSDAATPWCLRSSRAAAAFSPAERTNGPRFPIDTRDSAFQWTVRRWSERWCAPDEDKYHHCSLIAVVVFVIVVVNKKVNKDAARRHWISKTILLSYYETECSLSPNFIVIITIQYTCTSCSARVCNNIVLSQNQIEYIELRRHDNVRGTSTVIS